MSKVTGANAILANLRKKIPTVSGKFNVEDKLSSMMSTISLASYLPPTNGVTIASFKIASTEPTLSMITDGIASSFRGELSVLEGSLKIMDKSRYYTTVSAHLIRNTVTRAISDGVPNGFISLSKNIFMEERDSKTWKLITNSEGKQILVRDNSVETDADMEKLMSSMSSVGHEFTPEGKKMTAMASAVMNSVDIGVLVSYVVGDSQALAFVAQEPNKGTVGLVAVAGDQSLGYKTVPLSSIVRSFDLDEYSAELDVPAFQPQSLSGTVDINMIVDYYKKIGFYNKKYLEKFLDQVRTNAMV